MTGRDLNFLCLPGDGIGPEIMCATKTVLDALSGVGGYLWLRRPTAPRIALYFARELALKAHS